MDLEAIRTRANDICGLPLSVVTDAKWTEVQADVFALLERVDDLEADNARLRGARMPTGGR